jgi:6-pyruvoyl-tetrahydropterin synthase-like protein
MPSRSVRRLALTAFFALIATGLMAPLASNAFVPDFMDLPGHIGAAWQARLALDEGQFPLRVAPLEREGRRYAQFQLYGQLPYTAAALLQKLALPDSPEAPYVALKAVVWASLLMGGLHMFLLARYLGARDAASLVAGVAYMAAPYLLVNLHARGAVPEGIAQGLLPVALYHLLRFVAGGGRGRFAKATLAATAVLLTHLITFTYSLAAAGLLILLLSRARIVRRLARGAAVAAGTLVLCWYFVAPILALRGSLGIARGARGFMAHFVWLTPIPSLLSPSSVPPVPTGAMNLPPSIHPALGLVSVAGALLAAALWLRLVPAPPTRALRRFAPALLFVFALGLLLAWSPVDVWSHLPDIFSLAQFTYRLITLTMWSGALLLALALGAVLPRGHGTLAGAAGCTLVLMASGPYLASAPPWKGNEPFQHIRQPFFRGADGAAHYSLRLDRALLARPDTLVELAPPGSAPFARPPELAHRLRTTPSHLHVGGKLPPALAASGFDLTLRAGGETLAAMHLEGAAAGRSVPIAPPAVPADAMMTLLEWTATSPSGPVAPADLASLRTVIAPADRPFARIHAPEEAVAGHASVNVFQKRGDAFTVRVTADDEALLVLPLEYYPSLLDVRLDDARVPYAPYATPWGQVLAAIRLPPGRHRVYGRFAGDRAANVISLAGWIGLGALAASALLRRPRRAASVAG